MNNKFYHENQGVCPICEKNVLFRSEKEWFRDFLLCSNCGSIPRERALMQVIKTYYPNYKKLKIHESSPSKRGASQKMRFECKEYSASHFYPDVALGECHPKQGYRSENLENLTFADNSFDLFVTQDVMEHIMHPGKAFKEISRVLKPGGAHIFSVPIINKANKSSRRASIGTDGEIVHHFTPDYHGNPIDKKGSLVTMYWGYDIVDFILMESSLISTIVMIDNIDLGIRAEFIDVIVSKKLS